MEPHKSGPHVITTLFISEKSNYMLSSITLEVKPDNTLQINYFFFTTE